MNPPYGSPYPPPQHYAPHPPGSPVSPPPPAHHQYSYPMHYYPSYQYPPAPMMMYPQAPRTSSPHDTHHGIPSPSQIPSSMPGSKRKRKSTDGRRGDRSDDEGTSSSDHRATSQPHHTHALVDLKKRTKTDPPTCQHCKQYGFECTFFLPITETRFKKKKLEEENAEKERSEPTKSVSSPPTESSVFGPTSAAHLLHSQASISSRIYENYDLRYHHTFQVSKSGDGLITVQKPANDESQLAHPKPVDLRIERDVIEQLVNAYFNDVAPILPIVTKAEFLATPNPPPILVYSMCLVAAARRQVPQAIFDSIRYAVNNVIKAEDVLSTATIPNVQAILILCMTGDCHSQFVSNALSGLWIRLGTAIRMAQDLGLHRAESVKQNIELRRRLWGACLISDRWTSLTYGHPYMIDVQDCDARLPSSGDLNDLYMDELVRLSVILGKVLKTIYSPSGLTFTTDEMLYALLDEIERWKAGLPDHLKFEGSSSHRNAEQWSKLVKLTGESIDWLDANDQIYDVWLLVAYAATSCALVQYHTWARRKDDDAAAKLRKLRDTTAEIIALLYEATQGPHLPMEAPVLNPTGGVTPKPPVGLEYKKDPTRPGGGVFIAHGQSAKDGNFKDIPAGVIISSSDPDAEAAEVGSTLPATSSSTVAAPALTDRDRASLLSTSSSFAPPLPGDIDTSPSPSSIPPMHRNLAMSSAMRSTANQQQQQGSPAVATPTPPPLVNFTPIGRRQGSYSNVNPAMNQGQPQGNVQVMNVLDGPQGGNMLQEFAMTDNGFLEGIPGGMFDWGQWDTYFSRFSSGAANGMEKTLNVAMKRLFAKVQTSKPFVALPKSLTGLASNLTPGSSAPGSGPTVSHTVGLQPKYLVPPIPHPCPYDHLALLVTKEGLLIRPHIVGHDPKTEKPNSHVRVRWGKTVHVEEVAHVVGADDADWGESVVFYGIVGVLELFSGAHLLVITSKTEVGNVIDGSHTVYGVKGVTPIPLVEDKARITLNTLAAKNAQHARPSLLTSTTLDTVRSPLEPDIDDPETSASGPTPPRVQFSPHDQVKFMTPTSPSFKKDTGLFPSSPMSSCSDLSNPSEDTVASSPEAKTLAARLSFWSRLSKRTPVSPTSEILQDSIPAPDTALVERESLAKIIQEGKQDPAVVLDSILAATAPPPDSAEERHSELEDKIVRECVKEFTRGGMYFAYNFDITRSLQHKQEEIAKSQKKNELLANLNALPLPESEVAQSQGVEAEGRKVNPMSEPNPTLPLWRRVDKRFWWNESLSKPFIDAGVGVVVVLQSLGADIAPSYTRYYQVAHFAIPPDPVTHDEEVLVDYILVSRRSRYRAGLRYQRRGIDDDANVANFVETETIMRVESGYGLKPPPLLASDRTHAQNLDVLKRHFERTVPLYGPHTVLNLAEQHGKEGAITQGYREYMQEMNSKDARYCEYDFHTETKGMKYENISKLIENMDKTFDIQGYLWISDNTIMSQQKGVFRINCIDCLDRTNVVQSAFARYILNKQLGAVALLNPQGEGRTETDVVFNDGIAYGFCAPRLHTDKIITAVWANNGDAISRA
ncbi:hypothetical protein H0H81_011112 [Sphagnurus paluster]|uniref:SAC domain-containing protein n=1 Tax=Sphagnurus paluster TaxID=117069 RepID=A0A9P7K2E1_9AGAR|nr:hypothetical protein H0H81_011112 [Sphagnurus paluster]